MFVIKNRILFQKFSFKRSIFDNLIFISICVIIYVFTSTFFTSKSRNYLQSIMLNKKKQINQLIAKITRLKKNFAKQQQFFRDITRLFAIFTAKLKTMTNILNYIIENINVSNILNKKRDDIIFIANVQIKIIYKNYKLDMQFVDRKSKIAF